MTRSRAAIQADSAVSPRVQLKAPLPSTADMDGGWWPRSRSLSAQLPPLLTSLARLIGDIALVGYHVNAWDEAPDYVDVGKDHIRLQGFTTDDPHSVVVIAHNGQRLTLLVIPPGSTELLAQQALSSVSAPIGGTRVAAEVDSQTDRSLAEVATRLSVREGITDDTGKATIRQWVDDAAQQFAHLPIQSYVPILVEHIVRGQLTTAIRDQGHSPLPVRSQ